MTRVSTLAQNQILLRNNLNNQERLFDLQRQIGSGEKSDTYKGLRSDSGVLVTARTRQATLEQLVENNVQTKGKLDLTEAAVRAISEIAKELKAQFIRSEGAFDGRTLVLDAKSALTRVVGLLNTRDHNGNFLFAGSRTDTAPVTMTAIAGPPAFTLTFNNDTLVRQANIDENLTIDVGVLAATDPAAPTGSFQQLLEILNFFAGGFYPPPFGAEPLPPPAPPTATPAQIISLIDQALTTVTSLNADLGIKQQLVDDANVRLELEISLSEEFIAGIKDVDMAEVFTKVTQQQIALEASFQVTAQLANLSLVNFLR